MLRNILIGFVLLILMMAVVGGVFAQDDVELTPEAAEAVEQALEDAIAEAEVLSGEISPVEQPAPIVIEVGDDGMLSQEQAIILLVLGVGAAGGAYFLGTKRTSDAQDFMKQLNQNAGLKEFMEMVATGVVPAAALKEANETIRDLGKTYDKTTNRLIDFLQASKGVVAEVAEFADSITDGKPDKALVEGDKS